MKLKGTVHDTVSEALSGNSFLLYTKSSLCAGSHAIICLCVVVDLTQCDAADCLLREFTVDERKLHRLWWGFSLLGPLLEPLRIASFITSGNIGLSSLE